MEFSGFIQRLSGNVLTVYNVKAITDVKSVSAYEEISNGAFQKKEFRWSEDRNRWVDWAILNQENIQLAQPRSGETTLYFEFKYTKHTPNQGTVSKMTILYSNLPSLNEEVVETPRPQPGNSQTGPVGSDTINADFLNGQNGAFYLNRTNHQGTQTIATIDGLQRALYNLSNGLQNIEVQGALNEDQPGIGAYSRLDNNLLYFKTLYSDSGTVAITEDVSGQINFDVSISLTDASVAELFDWNLSQDASIIRLDAYDAIQDVSIAGAGIAWNGLTKTDNSIGLGGTLNLDTSLNLSGFDLIIKNSSTNGLFKYDSDYSAAGTLDPRWITDWGTITNYADASIIRLDAYQIIQDVSILSNINEIAQLDVSIVRTDAYQIIQDVSIAENTLGLEDVSTRVDSIETAITDIYDVSAGVITLLQDVSNWNTGDPNFDYDGSTIADTFQGQQHYDSDYFYVAVEDNVWIRLMRG